MVKPSFSATARLEFIYTADSIAAEAAAPCGACAPVWQALARAYGGEESSALRHPPEACAEMRRNLEKAYGGGDDGGLKAAA